MTPRPDLELHDVAAAFAFLTRLPVPVDHDRAGVRTLAAAWSWPLVGACLGAAAGAFGWLAAQALPMGLSAGLVVLVLVLATGALHEDGLADCADGLGSGAPRERALEIMKDSRVGAFGAVALVLAIGLRWQGLAHIAPSDLVLAAAGTGAASRLLMLLAMWQVSPASASGLSARAGQPQGRTVLVAGILTFVFVAPLGAPGLLAVCLGAFPALIALRHAVSRLGGQTGDVLGMVQQIGEIGMVLALVALL